MLNAGHALLDLRNQNKHRIYKEGGRLMLKYTQLQLDAARMRAPIEQQRPDRSSSAVLLMRPGGTDKKVSVKPQRSVDSTTDVLETMYAQQE